MNDIDLSALGEIESFGSLSDTSKLAAAAPTGQPLLLSLDIIDEDPDQPRIEFSEEKMNEMRASIRANIEAGRKPIKKPISVKPHPSIAGRWLLNDGARRYRSAKLEGLTEIEAFPDVEHDDYDQVVVNIQQEGHTPLEIALFIQKREKAGDKKGFIAKRLGKRADWISKHAALIDMAPSVRAAYDAGRCRDVEALYMLVRNFEDFPDQIDALCESGDLLTQQSVRAFIQDLKAPKPAVNSGVATKPIDQFSPPPPGSGAGFSSPNAGTSSSGGEDNGAGTETPVVDPERTSNAGSDGDGDQSTQGGGPVVIEATVKPAGGRATDPDRVRKPIVMVSHDDRQGRVLLEKRTVTGLVWVKYDDDGNEVEVDAGLVKLLGILEGA